MRRGPAGPCRGLLLAVLLLLPHAAMAQPAQPARAAEPYNTVELQAEANREIPNDTLNASLYAEASDADAAKVADALIAKLQAGMQLSSLSFSVSRDLRVNTENELITEGVMAFRARADIVRQALGGKGYKLRRIAINTSGSSPPPRPLLRMSAASAAAEVTAPQLEGGLSTVTVSVSGTVEVE